MKRIEIKNIYEKVRILLENMEKDHVSEYSAQCSYYTILSFIPFVILLITLIQYTNINPQTIYEAISRIIPSSMNELVLNIVQEVYSKSLGTISVSIIVILWSAGRGLYALTKGLKSVYNINLNKTDNYILLRIRAIFQTIVFILLITVGLIISVFGNTFVSLIQKYFGALKDYNTISAILTEFGLVFTTFIIFLFLYKFIPKHKVTFKSQIYGALFGATTLNVISFIFSKYLEIFKGFSITYGSLTTLILIMMWTYSCFYTVFLGAELNKQISVNR